MSLTSKEIMVTKTPMRKSSKIGVRSNSKSFGGVSSAILPSPKYISANRKTIGVPSKK